MSAVRDYVDEYSQRVCYEYLDPADLIIQYSNDSRRFRDINFWGHQRFMTILDFRVLTGCDEKMCYKFAELYNGNAIIGNANINNLTPLSDFRSTGAANFMELRIPVLYYEHKTVNSDYKTKITSEKGTTVKDEEYRNGGYKKPRTYDND